jgi:hypothetical protein
MTANERTILTELADLDPTRDEPIASPEQADETLRWVLAHDRTEPVTVAAIAQPRRRRAVLAGAAAAVFVGALVVGMWPRSTPAAYASWVPLPTELNQEVVRARVDRCPKDVSVPRADDPNDLLTYPTEPVIAEKRGSYTFVLLVGDNAYTECFVTEGDGSEQWDVMANAVTGVGVLPPAPAAAEINALATGRTSWGAGDGQGEGAVITAYGMAGPDVKSIEVTTSNGTRAHASVNDGWWAVWFPGSVPVRDEVTVTATDGSTRNVNLTAVTRPTME